MWQASKKGFILSKDRLNLWAKYSEPPKKITKIFFFSELQEYEIQSRVQPNFPIIILILLTAFHKFVKSRGANTSVMLQKRVQYHAKTFCRQSPKRTIFICFSPYFKFYVSCWCVLDQRIALIFVGQQFSTVFILPQGQASFILPTYLIEICPRPPSPHRPKKIPRNWYICKGFEKFYQRPGLILTWSILGKRCFQ